MTESKRGFSALSKEQMQRIASKGGKSAHARGVAHHFSIDEARAAGRRGGQKVSVDRKHMAAIGRKGGLVVSRDRGHMATIGRKGGQFKSGGVPS